ncbi:MAG: ROK family transcriptional regulator [Sphingomonadales bacterium]|nr:ROK family transcriptional regulator [Sphingomonadales bacterium]
MRIADSQFNRLQVLRELCRREPVSRTELTAATGLNAATISGIVGDLVERGIVVEQRVQPARTGRPRLNLRLSSRTLYTVTAVVSGEEGLRIGIADVRGEIIHSALPGVERTSCLQALSDNLAASIRKIVQEADIAWSQILNVQVGLPAVVERTTGVVHYFETFDAVPFGMRAALERQLGVPTSIDHAMSLLAACEHWFGGDPGRDDFIVLTVELGIASTAYRNGVLYTGRNGFEPEFGHTKIYATGGRPCRCGGSGCLEVYASMSAILAQLGEYAFPERDTPPELFDRFDRIVLPGGVPAPAAASLLAQAGGCLGTAVANLVNIEGPESIVILVPSLAFANAISPAFDEALARDTFPPLRGRTTVQFRVLEAERYLRGGAALTLERLYEPRVPLP